VRLLGVELRWLDLHLRTAQRTAYGAVAHRPVVLARVVTDVGEGWGECAALAEPTYSEEYAQGAWDVLAEHLVPRFLAAPPPLDSALGGPEAPGGNAGCEGAVDDDGIVVTLGRWVQGALAGIRGHRMARACLEMAVVDAALRAQGCSLARALGVDARSVEAGAVVGLCDDLGLLVDEVGQLVAQGYRRVKLKIAPGWDRAPLETLRTHFADLGLQADANGAYDPGSWQDLVALDRFGLLCLEQPYDPEDLRAHAALSRVLATPVCLDESVTSLARLEEALALGACDVVCVKPGPLGGLSVALGVHRRCRRAGVPLWVGGMYETGLARAANAALSGLPGFDLPGDLDGGDRFVEGDPSGALAVTGGRAPVWDAPGVGPPPAAGALQAVSARVCWLPAA